MKSNGSLKSARDRRAQGGDERFSESDTVVVGTAAYAPTPRKLESARLESRHDMHQAPVGTIEHLAAILGRRGYRIDAGIAEIPKALPERLIRQLPKKETDLLSEVWLAYAAMHQEVQKFHPDTVYRVHADQKDQFVNAPTETKPPKKRQDLLLELRARRLGCYAQFADRYAEVYFTSTQACIEKLLAVLHLEVENQLERHAQEVQELGLSENPLSDRTTATWLRLFDQLLIEKFSNLEKHKQVKSDTGPHGGYDRPFIDVVLLQMLGVKSGPDKA